MIPASRPSTCALGDGCGKVEDTRQFTCSVSGFALPGCPLRYRKRNCLPAWTLGTFPPPSPPHSPSGSVRHSCVTLTCASYHFHFSSPCFLAHSDPKGPSHSATCGSYASLKQWVAACLGMPLSLGKAGSIPVPLLLGSRGPTGSFSSLFC